MQLIVEEHSPTAQPLRIFERSIKDAHPHVFHNQLQLRLTAKKMSNESKMATCGNGTL